jgi:hypothetical protein
MKLLDKLFSRFPLQPDELLPVIGSSHLRIAAQDKVQFPNFDPRYAYPAVLDPSLDRLRSLDAALEEIAALAGMRHQSLLRTQQDLKDCAIRAIKRALAHDPRVPLETISRPVICNILADDSRGRGMRVWLEVPRQYQTHSCAVWDRDEALSLAGRVVRNKLIQCLVRPGTRGLSFSHLINAWRNISTPGVTYSCIEKY